MLRDKSLIPLSHQHQHALALCVRIERAAPIPNANLPAWQAEIAQQFKNEIGIHFTAEEQIVFPAAREFRELAFLADELTAEHAELRKSFARAELQELSSQELLEFSRRLSTHIRREERQLFELLQQLLKPHQLEDVGQKLEKALKEAEQSCAIPNEATRLRPAKP